MGPVGVLISGVKIYYNRTRQSVLIIQSVLNCLIFEVDRFVL